MTATEPSGWELKRMLELLRADVREGNARIEGRFDKLVSWGEFDADRSRVNERLKDVADDIAAEKGEREKGDARQQTEIDKMAATIKWVVAAVMIPLAALLTTIVLYVRGTGR